MKINQLLAAAVIAAFAMPVMAQTAVGAMKDAASTATSNAVNSGKAAVGDAVSGAQDNLKQRATNAITNRVGGQTMSTGTTAVVTDHANTVVTGGSAVAVGTEHMTRTAATGTKRHAKHGVRKVSGKKSHKHHVRRASHVKHGKKHLHHENHVRREHHAIQRAQYVPAVQETVQPIQPVMQPVRPAVQPAYTTTFKEGHPVREGSIVSRPVYNGFYQDNVWQGH